MLGDTTAGTQTAHIIDTRDFIRDIISGVASPTNGATSGSVGTVLS